MTFTIPKALREVVGRRDVRVGTVASIQTFGSFGANFHPHVHAIVTDGVFHPLGAQALFFESVEWWDVAAVA